MTRKYLDFFIRNAKSFHIFLQGGRRSRKTWSTLEWLDALTMQMSLSAHRKMKVIVLCYSYNHIQETANDFEKCLKQKTWGNPKRGYTKGAYWQFKYCDDITKAIGTECDFLFVNEASAFFKRQDDFNILETYMPSVRCQVYYNYNPTNSMERLLSKYLLPDKSNILCTTFRDNPFLTEAQIKFFKDLKRMALSPKASIFDIKNYKVLYLGEFDSTTGAVFHDIETCPPSVYHNVRAEEYFAMDFGFSLSGDPTTLMGVKLTDKKIYVNEYIYERGLTSNKELEKRLYEVGLNKDVMIIGDHGGMGRGRMDDMMEFGWTMCNAPKGIIADGLSQMNAYDAIVITKNSVNAISEFQRYELVKTRAGNEQFVGEDHTIDAVRYAFIMAKRESK